MPPICPMHHMRYPRPMAGMRPILRSTLLRCPRAGRAPSYAEESGTAVEHMQGRMAVGLDADHGRGAWAWDTVDHVAGLGGGGMDGVKIMVLSL